MNNSIKEMPSCLNQRSMVQCFEDILKDKPGSTVGDYYPLKHTFVNGAYIRELSVPKGVYLTTKIHKIEHPFFLMKGEVSIFNSEDAGGTKRIKAPCWGVTPAGTKRAAYIHEDTVWVTVHVTKERDLDKIENQIIAKDYKEFELLENSMVRRITRFFNNIGGGK